MAPITVLYSQPYFVSAILQAFFYALYLVSLTHALRWLLYEEEGWILRGREKVNWIILTITFIVFVFTTADVVFEILFQLTFAGDTDSRAAQQLIVASVVAENTTVLITDAVLIIRCWLVYQKSWSIVCFPFILWIANAACLILWVTVYTIKVFREGIPHNPVSLLALQLFYCFSSATNLYATCAIVYRLWRVAKTSTTQSSVLYRISRFIAATGILYTSTSLPLVVTGFFLLSLRPAYMICDAISFSMAGITFNLLLIRVGQLRAEIDTGVNESTRDVSGSVMLSTVQLTIPTAASNSYSINSVNAYQRKQTDVNVQGK